MDTIDKLLLENEKKANRFATFILFFLSFGLVVLWISGTIHISEELRYYSIITYTLVIVACLFSSLYTIIKRYEGTDLKYLYIYVSVISACTLCIFHVYTGWVFFIIPIIIAIRYYDKKLIVYISIICFISLFVAQVVGLEFGYITYNLDVNAIVDIQNDTNITFYDGLTKTLILRGYVNKENLEAYMIRLFVFESFVLLLISILSYFAASHGYELICEAAKESEKAKQADMNIAISQIRPHFLYNSLTAIMAIDGNPPKTIEAIGNFGRYLRNNLNSLNSDNLIMIDRELEHIKNYIYLEKLRFGDKLNIEYDIKCKNIELPPLSIQMLVENGIKHGISKKKNGGTITIKTYEDEKHRYVEVIDNGLGFDVDKVLNSKEHIGLESSKYRLENIGAKLIIESKIGKGTNCLITMNK